MGARRWKRRHDLGVEVMTILVTLLILFLLSAVAVISTALR